VLCQFVVTPIDSPDLLGLVVAYNPDFRHRFVHVAAVMRPAVIERGLGIEALLGLARYVFFGWDFRMMLLETNGFTYRAFSSGERAGLFEVAGRIPGSTTWAAAGGTASRWCTAASISMPSWPAPSPGSCWRAIRCCAPVDPVAGSVDEGHVADPRSVGSIPAR